MTEYTIEQIKEMLEKITQGEWIYEKYLDDAEMTFALYSLDKEGKEVDIIEAHACVEHVITDEDARFIASAPSIVRWLVGEVERLQARDEEWKQEFEERHDQRARDFANLNAAVKDANKTIDRLQEKLARLELQEALKQLEPMAHNKL